MFKGFFSWESFFVWAEERTRAIHIHNITEYHRNKSIKFKKKTIKLRKWCNQIYNCTTVKVKIAIKSYFSQVFLQLSLSLKWGRRFKPWQYSPPISDSLWGYVEVGIFKLLLCNKKWYLYLPFHETYKIKASLIFFKVIYYYCKEYYEVLYKYNKL